MYIIYMWSVYIQYRYDKYNILECVGCGLVGVFCVEFSSFVQCVCIAKYNNVYVVQSREWFPFPLGGYTHVF